MSAYGAIPKPMNLAAPLTPTTWACKAKRPDSTPKQLTIHHLTLATARLIQGLVEYLRAVLVLDIEAGRTYPQETLEGEGVFEAYFFAADVFVAIVNDETAANEISVNIEQSQKGRTWDDCIAGFYYIKPNYPGRSSHICNAGFIVPANHRGGGYGSILGKSYLHYAPKLGYRASVFNLVYVNNIASVRIWESLDFAKAGLIPKAGRLKRADGQGEEWVDAWVFYKSFIDA